jgi:hypothetical protein
MVNASQITEHAEYDLEGHKERVISNLVTAYLQTYKLECYSKEHFDDFKSKILDRSNIAEGVYANRLAEKFNDLQEVNAQKSNHAELYKAESELLKVAKFEQQFLGGSLNQYLLSLLNRSQEFLLELEAMRNSGFPHVITDDSLFAEPSYLKKLARSNIQIRKYTDPNIEEVAVEASEHFGICFQIPLNHNLLFAGVHSQGDLVDTDKKSIFVITAKIDSSNHTSLSVWYSEENSPFYLLKPQKMVFIDQKNGDFELEIKLSRKSKISFIQNSGKIDSFFSLSDNGKFPVNLLVAPNLILSNEKDLKIKNQTTKVDYYRLQYNLGINCHTGDLELSPTGLNIDQLPAIKNLCALGQEIVYSAAYGVKALKSNIQGITYCIPYKNELVFAAFSNDLTFLITAEKQDNGQHQFTAWFGEINNPLEKFSNPKIEVSRAEFVNFLIAKIYLNKDIWVKIESHKSIDKSTYSFNSNLVEGYLEITVAPKEFFNGSIAPSDKISNFSLSDLL